MLGGRRVGLVLVGVVALFFFEGGLLTLRQDPLFQSFEELGKGVGFFEGARVKIDDIT